MFVSDKHCKVCERLKKKPTAVDVLISKKLQKKTGHGKNKYRLNLSWSQICVHRLWCVI